METINGLSYGYLPGLEMEVGDRVRWYVLSSTNFEIHTPHWHVREHNLAGMQALYTVRP